MSASVTVSLKGSTVPKGLTGLAGGGVVWMAAESSNRDLEEGGRHLCPARHCLRLCEYLSASSPVGFAACGVSFSYRYLRVRFAAITVL